jgi:CRP-like cAMP-binding protein
MSDRDPFILKLETFAILDEGDRDLLRDRCRRVVSLRAKEEIVQEGTDPQVVHLVLSGYACRYKILADGSRQIVGFLLPGDFCDLHVFILDELDHNIATLTDCRLAVLSRDDITALCGRPLVARALWWSTLVDQAILREWLLNIGRRSADERVAHLLCELLERLRNVGLVSTDNTFTLPVTQGELADTLGLTVVHVNRMIRNLRDMSLIAISGRQISVRDVDGLKRFCGFRANYLHMDGARSGRDDLLAESEAFAMRVD